MDRARDELLAGAGLALHEHRHPVRGDEVDELHHPPHPRAREPRALAARELVRRTALPDQVPLELERGPLLLDPHPVALAGADDRGAELGRAGVGPERAEEAAGVEELDELTGGRGAPVDPRRGEVGQARVLGRPEQRLEPGALLRAERAADHHRRDVAAADRLPLLVRVGGEEQLELGPDRRDQQLLRPPVGAEHHRLHPVRGEVARELHLVRAAEARRTAPRAPRSPPRSRPGRRGASAPARAPRPGSAGPGSRNESSTSSPSFGPSSLEVGWATSPTPVSLRFTVQQSRSAGWVWACT